jgi:putative selenate reductase
MGDIMRPLPFDELVQWALAEHRQHGTVFGLPAAHVFRPAGRRIRDPFGHVLSTPIGPAAGPHTQLAQNIVVSYLAGARVVELKTVQEVAGEAMRAAVPKPCIDAEDEGLNCEWSTELTVEQALAQYVEAHLAVRVLAVELGLGDGNDVVFDASVGYDLAGIRGPVVDGFIEGLRDADTVPAYREAMSWLDGNLGLFSRVDRRYVERMPARICDSVTLSTMHGCPAEEIERIANHLLDKGLHTSVKCNPTLLGYDVARTTLDRLGYSHIQFDDHHFTDDLQYDDAVAMFARLRNRADAVGLGFGLKLSNTLPNDVTRGRLPASEMYLSGRALLPLTLTLATRLARAFDGKLPISYAGGADARNLTAILGTGIQPVTVATTLLKPGGYGRLRQLAALATDVMTDAGRVDADSVDAVLAEVMGDPRTHKRHREKVGSRKTTAPLPLTDCYTAPCEHGGCPIGQQVPEYLALTAAGRHAEAFRVVARDNPAPSITGVLCPQPCRTRCTRLDYDTGIDIRGAKLAVADAAQEAFVAGTLPAPLVTDARVAVVGAGPAGIATAVFLRRNGVAVEVFEKLDGPYGIVGRIIPRFRVSPEQVDRDYRLAVATGVRFHFGCPPDYDLADLRSRFDHVVLATGSWGRAPSPVRDGAAHVHDALDFLWDTHSGAGAPLGRRVVVVGAGDVAMDCARTALRSDGVEHVALVYRRTEPFMPAAQEDVDAVRAEGIEIVELLAPIAYDGTVLRCERTELAGYADDGRRTTRGTGVVVDIEADTVIGATGATIDTRHYDANGVARDEVGRPVLDSRLRAGVAGGLDEVYVAGDGRLGADTVVGAIADAKVVARSILGAHGIRADLDRSRTVVFTPQDLVTGRRGILADRLAPTADGTRCLRCDEVCEVCTEVCPNRANVAVTVPGMADRRQVVHLDGLCNDCGNCGTFCPLAGQPHRDKITVFWTRPDFDASTNVGYLPTSQGYLVRLPSLEVRAHRRGAGDLPLELERVLATLESEHPWLLRRSGVTELEGAVP